MHLSYHTLSHPKEKEFKESGALCTIFEKDDFKAYKQALEDNNKNVHIVAKTSLKKIDEDNENSNKDWVEIPDKDGELRKFKTYKKRHKLKTLGYLPLSETEFVQIESGVPILILLIPIILGLLAGLCFINPSVPVDDPLSMEDDMDDWDGNDHKNGGNSEASADSTTIPGFAQVRASGEDDSVQLYNPKENTVKFIYTITEQASEKTVETFDTAEDAMAYASSHEYKYKNDYSNESSYKLVDAETNEVTDIYIEYSVQESVDHKFDVVETKSKVIYFTKAINPGKAVNWNIYESLESGKHDLKFRIATYDVDTDVQCYGAVLDVEAIIQ